jgi:hypothetical protein
MTGIGLSQGIPACWIFDAQVAAISWEKLVATGPRSRQSWYLHVLPMVSFGVVLSGEWSSRALQGGRGDWLPGSPGGLGGKWSRRAMQAGWEAPGELGNHSQ